MCIRDSFRSQSRDDHIMQSAAARGLQGNDQGASLGEMLLEVFPLSANCKRAEPLLPEVALHIGGIDAMGSSRIECTLDVERVGGAVWRLTLLRLPVLHHHGNAGRSAAIFFLLYERDIQPDARKVRGQEHPADPEQQAPD